MNVKIERMVIYINKDGVFTTEVENKLDYDFMITITPDQKNENIENIEYRGLASFVYDGSLVSYHLDAKGGSLLAKLIYLYKRDSSIISTVNDTPEKMISSFCMLVSIYILGTRYLPRLDSIPIQFNPCPNTQVLSQSVISFYSLPFLAITQWNDFKSAAMNIALSANDFIGLYSSYFYPGAAVSTDKVTIEVLSSFKSNLMTLFKNVGDVYKRLEVLERKSK